MLGSLVKNWTFEIADIISGPDWISLKHLADKFSQRTLTCVEYPYSPVTFTSWGAHKKFRSFFRVRMKKTTQRWHSSLKRMRGKQYVAVSGLAEQLLLQAMAVFVLSLCPSLQASSQICIFIRATPTDTGCYSIVSERPYRLSY